VNGNGLTLAVGAKGKRMNWAHAASGLFQTVAGPDMAGLPAVENASLRELFADLAERDTRRRIEEAQEEEAKRREARVREYARRVDKDLGRQPGPPKSRRGAARPVILMHRVDARGVPTFTPIDVGTGLPTVFPKVSDAARSIGRTADQVCGAINGRRRSSGGCVFAYVDQLPAGHVCAPARASAAAPGTAGPGHAAGRLSLVARQLRAERRGNERLAGCRVA